MDDKNNEWKVWDDMLNPADAKHVLAWRERYYPDYEFKASGSTLHGHGYFQVEGRSRADQP